MTITDGHQLEILIGRVWSEMYMIRDRAPERLYCICQYLSDTHLEEYEIGAVCTTTKCQRDRRNGKSQREASVADARSGYYH